MATEVRSRVCTPQENAVARLARFFPAAAPVRIPVRLSKSGAGEVGSDGQTVIEFGTPHEVLFASNLPLEFADRVRMRNSDGSLDVEAVVVAVQYNNGQVCVAARFLHAVPNWIVKL